MARAGYCPSGRFFEAAACGTPIISDWFEGLDTFFRDREEVFIVNTASDVMSVMSLSDEELQRTAQLALQRTLAEHTGECRARELVQFLEEARWASAVSDTAQNSLEARS
jgi:spore maturation protein CgeB